MKSSQKRNLAASIRQRLLLISRENREDFGLVLVRYAIERLLYRLGKSKYADSFLLKGAMLFLVWSGERYRPTRDLDLLGFGSSDVNEVAQLFQDICVLDVEQDGLAFKAETVIAEEIREQSSYPGIRVSMYATLENARIPIQVDIGFGDAITPAPEEVEFPALLDLPAPRLRSYPVYTVIAEKLEAVVSLGEVNSRMKDFYDLNFMRLQFEFVGQTLVEAIQATFQRRQTEFPTRVPVGLTQEFATIKTPQWDAFLRRNQLPIEQFTTVVEAVYTFLYGPLLAASRGETFSKSWAPGGPWK